VVLLELVGLKLNTSKVLRHKISECNKLSLNILHGLIVI